VQVGDGSTSATNTGAISAAAVELRAQHGNVYALAGNTEASSMPPASTPPAGRSS